ncbi:MAG TPA: hypothetical protein VNR36_10755 [Pseudolysinimonas sp.]|nr:hypothetical protein [Pseudolysinimonas sp.]
MTTPTPGYWTPNTAPRFGTAPPGRTPTNTYAWLGLIISVSGFLIPLGVNGLLGAAFSIVGMREAAKLRAAGHENTGRGIAVAGLITGLANIVVVAALGVGIYLVGAWFFELMERVTTELQYATLAVAPQP